MKCGQVSLHWSQQSFQCTCRSGNNSCTHGLESDDGLGTINEEEECGSTSLFIPSSYGGDVKEIALHGKDHLIKGSKRVALDCSVEFEGVVQLPEHTEMCLHHMV